MQIAWALILSFLVGSVLAQVAERPPYKTALELYQGGRVTESYQLAWRSVDDTKSRYGAISPQYAQHLRLLSLITAALKQDSLALQFTLQEIRCREYLSQDSGKKLLEAHLNKANLCVSLDKLELVFITTQQMLSLADSLDIASDSLRQWQLQAAKLYQAANKRQLADSLYTLIQQTSGDSLLSMQANYHQSLLRGTLGEEKVINFISTLKQQGDTSNIFYADLCYQRASLALSKAKWQEAKGWYEAARRHYEQNAAQARQAYASVLNNLGAIALADNNATEGGYLIETAFDYRSRTASYEQGSFWVALTNLATYYQKNSNPEESSALYTQHIHLDDTVTDYPWQYAIVLNNLAAIYQEEGDYEQADKYFSHAINILKRSQLPNQRAVLHEASVYSNAARNYQDLVRFDTAIYYHQRSLELIKQTSGRESATYVAAISGLAALYHDIGYLVEAEIFFQEAINIQKKISGIENNTYANLLSNYALVCQANGNYPKSAELLEKSIKIKEELLGVNHPEYLATLSNIGLLYLEEGKYTQARPMLELVVDMQQEIWGEEHPAMIASYLNLARLEVILGNYPEAEPLLQLANRLSATHFGVEHPEQAKVQLEMAKFYFTLGNFTKAKPLLLTSQKIFSDSYGVNHPDLATAYQSLAALYEAQDSIDLAEQFYQKALSIDANTLGKQHPSYASTLNNLATLYQNNNEYEKALPLLEESLSISEQLLGKEHPYYSTTLLNLGLLYQDVNEMAKAREFIEQAVKVRREVLGEIHPDFAYAQYSLAVLYHKLNEFAKAEEIFYQVIESYIDQIQDYFPSLSEQEQGAYYQRVEPIFHAFRDFVIDQVYYRAEEIDQSRKQRLLTALYDLQLVTKAMLLDASYQLRQAIEKGDEEAAEEFRQWLAVKEELGQAYTLSRQDREEQQIDVAALESEANRLEKLLSLKSETFASTIESKRVTWQQVRSQLHESEAAIEIIRVEQDSSISYLALILESGKEVLELCLMSDGEAMENKNYYYYQNAIKFRITDEISYDQYWLPIREKLSDRIESIYVAPDGIYHKINVNSLFNSDEKQYVIDEINLRILSSTRDLTRVTEQPTSSQAYLFGSPDFQYQVGYQDSEALIDTVTALTTNTLNMLESTPFLFGISELPGTRAEVEEIDQMLENEQWEAHTYLGEKAGEGRVKSAKDPRILHIASHGYFLSDLSNTKNSKKAYGTHFQNISANPLLRAGILLAGAEHTIYQRNTSSWQAEDGILTAYEAMNLRLNETELVVLSACETGLGDIKNGEGVYGLQRAFLVAGTQSILMSLWNVSDNSTAELMTNFYRNWLSGQSKYQALRNAQIELKKKQPDPYYWGGFVLIER